MITYSGCKEFYPDVEVFNRSDFPKKALLKGDELYLDSLWSARILYIQDSVIVVVERTRSPFVKLFNVKDGRKIGEYILAGRGPDELTACSQFQIDGDWIWAIDMTQNKYLKYRKKEPFNNSFDKPVSAIVFKDIPMITYPFVIDSNRVVGGRISSDKLLTSYDLEKQGIDTTIDIPYPFDIKGRGLHTWQSFEHRLSADRDHIYVAYCYTDLIDIYDKTGSLVRRLFGPDHFMPEFEIVKVGDQGVRDRPGEKSRFSYISPVMTKDGLMVLYNGRLMSDDNYLLTQLFLFSAFGEPLVEFSLDPPIFNFCVDDAIKRIYGLTDSPDYQVICYDYGEYL